MAISFVVSIFMPIASAQGQGPLPLHSHSYSYWYTGFKVISNKAFTCTTQPGIFYRCDCGSASFRSTGEERAGSHRLILVNYECEYCGMSVIADA